ncbi:MAG TPA: hypothetical protein VF885_05925 [Arthrobacter sp.]
MPPTPSPAPLAPVPLEWWQNVALFSPLAVLFAALLAAVINFFILRQRTAADGRALEQKRLADESALRQKEAADSKAEWWKRAQWALDSSLSDNPDRVTLGLGIMEVLAESAPGPEETRIITVAWADPLAAAAEAHAAAAGGGGTGEEAFYGVEISGASNVAIVGAGNFEVDAPREPGDNGVTTEEKE